MTFELSSCAMSYASMASSHPFATNSGQNSKISDRSVSQRYQSFPADVVLLITSDHSILFDFHLHTRIHMPGTILGVIRLVGEVLSGQLAVPLVWDFGLSATSSATPCTLGPLRSSSGTNCPEEVVSSLEPEEVLEGAAVRAESKEKDRPFSCRACSSQSFPAIWQGSGCSPSLQGSSSSSIFKMSPAIILPETRG